MLSHLCDNICHDLLHAMPTRSCTLPALQPPRLGTPSMTTSLQALHKILSAAQGLLGISSTSLQCIGASAAASCSLDTQCKKAPSTVSSKTSGAPKEALNMSLGAWTSFEHKFNIIHGRKSCKQTQRKDRQSAPSLTARTHSQLHALWSLQ